jgi:hypothetical protein
MEVNMADSVIRIIAERRFYKPGVIGFCASGIMRY